MPLEKPHNMGVWSSFMITRYTKKIPESLVIHAFPNISIQSVDKSYK